MFKKLSQALTILTVTTLNPFGVSSLQIDCARQKTYDECHTYCVNECSANPDKRGCSVQCMKDHCLNKCPDSNSVEQYLYDCGGFKSWENCREHCLKVYHSRFSSGPEACIREHCYDCPAFSKRK